jgi:hypothetical protein
VQDVEWETTVTRRGFWHIDRNPLLWLAPVLWPLAARFLQLPESVRVAVSTVLGVAVLVHFLTTTTGPWRFVTLASAFTFLGLSALDVDLLSRSTRQFVGAVAISMFGVMIVSMFKAPRRKQATN